MREDAAAQKHAAEQLMQTAKAKLADAAQKYQDARELRESVSAGFEKAAREAAAAAAAQAERERERAARDQLQAELMSVSAAAAAAEEERAKAKKNARRLVFYQICRVSWGGSYPPLTAVSHHIEGSLLTFVLQFSFGVWRLGLSSVLSYVFHCFLVFRFELRVYRVYRMLVHAN